MPQVPPNLKKGLPCSGIFITATGLALARWAEDYHLFVLGLAIYMGGGPAAVYGGDALRAYDQFAGTKP